MNIAEEKQRIKNEILMLEKELKKLNSLDDSHLDFTKLNKISRHAFSSLGSDFIKIAISIHFLEINRQNVFNEDIIEISKYRNAKIRDLTSEQIAESNELLQKMLEPFAEKVKEKVALIKTNKGENK